MDVIIRYAVPKDAKRILEIYSYYIKNTAITFEYDIPALPEFQHRIENIIKKYPYLVAEQNGKVQGFAYANTFIARRAYDWSCETTIYLDFVVQKCGLGRKLYTALEEELKQMGILNLYACIAYPETDDKYLNKNSFEFHSHLGFKTVGKFQKCGYKFGNWYDMIWLEKIIGTHLQQQPQVIFKKEKA